MLSAVNFLPFMGPILMLILGILATLVAEPFLSRADKHKFLPWVGAIATGLSAASLSFTVPGHLHGVLVLDPVRGGMVLVLLAVLFLSLAAMQQNLKSDDFEGGEPYVLLQLATLGAILMVMASQSIALFIGMELMSLAIYPLVGMRRNQADSAEAVLKYFAMGAVFSAVFLYGASLCYGATGTVAFGGVIAEGRTGVFNLGFFLMAAGLLFKMGMVPFHFWSPDAYTGASSGTTTFMAGAVKVGSIVGLGSLWLNFMVSRAGFPLNAPLSLKVTIPPMLFYQMSPESFASLKSIAVLLFGVLSLLSIAVGSLSVLGQTSLRRLFAFSGIANAGFMGLGFLFPSLMSGYIDLSVTWYYLAGYALATSGALACLAALSGPGDMGDHITALSGSARQKPMVGLGLTVFLASLAGLPPMAGFVAKFQLFQGILINASTGLFRMEGLPTHVHFAPDYLPIGHLSIGQSYFRVINYSRMILVGFQELVNFVLKFEYAVPAIALVFALVGSVAYFKVVVAIWSQPGSSPRPIEKLPALLGLAILLSVVALVALAIFPKGLFGG